jgi:CHAT domain-containing protein
MTMPIRARLSLALALPAAVALSPAAAQPISLRDSFPLGSGAATLCSAQAANRDPALEDLFDRAYAIVCRDAAVPVGWLYVLRTRRGDPAARLAELRAGKAECSPVSRGEIDALGAVDVADCRLRAADADYRVYLRRAGNRLYAAEGLAGYDSALRLGLRTLIADRPVEGEISVATTGAGDPAAFARAQAGAMDPAGALTEAYRRNNKGAFAESAEFFAALAGADPGGTSRAEAAINQALQQSNLGALDQASILFGQAEAMAGADPVLTRMLRNDRAIHLMNQELAEAALAELDKPLPAGAEIVRSPPGGQGIDAETAARLNADPPSAPGLRAAASALLPAEKARILDAQASHLRGIILRLGGGRPGEASAALNAALAELAAVREGRVISTMWMRAQIFGELGAIAEQGGDPAEAQRRHQAAVALLANDYPGSPALLSAQARLAGLHARAGRTEPALALYREIVDAGAAGGDPSPALRRALGPYFALLADEAARPEAVADMFKASQILVRPGVAQTQAVLARELSGGSDEASRLFRQSVTLARDIERGRIEVARLAAAAAPANAARIETLRGLIAQMETDQVATQSKLARFPRYRVVAGGAMPLTELQQVLRPGEAYYKMIVVGENSYAIFATPARARAFRLGAGPVELEREVDALRATIAVEESGKLLTYPFDVALAHKLFRQLFEPVAGELTAVRHLVFEPDGAMLRLPPNLLVMDQAAVDAYLARAGRPESDLFDLTRVKWLGRDRDVSTAVSARSFRDVRQVAPSRAAKNYLGFGENRAPGRAAIVQSALRRVLGQSSACAWPLTEWVKPISSAELLTAGGTIERRGGAGTEIVTGEAFTDSAIRQRGDLGQYRILHFATHGLVTAPRPECPARPALMTSFGGSGSDGLLTFSEIYDLKIDADLVILSACDTAGKASLAATREAGVTTGGDFALDGLVRAFVGAGGRSVIASHWPVPDDFDATNRLISGLFTAPPGTAIAAALRSAQTKLMAEPATSHPYYWAGFAIIGDGAAPVLPRL